MDKAYQHFFKGGGFPKFKSKHHPRQSYQYPQRVKIDGNKVFLPKVGWVKCKGLRKEFVGKIKTVTVSYEAYQYHASILMDIEDDAQKPYNNPNKAIGLDVGVSLVVADSDGNKVKPLNLTRELEKLRLRSKQLSRKKKGSKNREKAKAGLYVNLVATPKMRILSEQKTYLSVGYKATMLPCK